MAFLGILLFHAEVFPNGGGSGVNLFFVLSGFLLTVNYKDKNIPCNLKSCFCFALKKIKKLYPLYIITMLIMSFYFAKTNTDCSVREYYAQNIGKLILCILLLQTWIPNIEVFFAFNTVGWFFSSIVFMSFLYPFMLHFLKGTKKSIIYPLFIVTTLILELFLVTAVVHFCSLKASSERALSICFWFTYVFPPFRSLDLFIGANLGFFYLNVGKSFAPHKYTATFLEIIALCAYCLQETAIRFLKIHFYWGYPLLGITSCVVIFLVAEKKGMISAALEKKIPASLGNLSTYAFLIHGPMLYFVDYGFDRLLHMRMPNPSRACIVFVVTIMFSIMYRFIINAKSNYTVYHSTCK